MAQLHPYTYFDTAITPLESANLHIASSAVLYGLSVYTVFPIHLLQNGSLVAFRLSDHYQRLLNSAKIIGIDTFQAEWTYQKFEQTVTEVVKANSLSGNVFARATVHVDQRLAGTRSRGLSSVVSIFLYDADPILPSTGARLKTSVWRRIPDYAIPSRAKVNGAYVNSVLAKQDALDSGYDDCVFLDAAGHVCELSAANIFLVRHGKLITPDSTSDLLEGINRKTVIEMAEHLGLTVQERVVDLTELYIADEIFACGTSAYVSPILQIDGRMVGEGIPGPISKQVANELKKALEGHDQAFAKLTTVVGTISK